jgi:hypothetical protein
MTDKQIKRRRRKSGRQMEGRLIDRLEGRRREADTETVKRRETGRRRETDRHIARRRETD